MEPRWVELDGSEGEGGGQILRSSLTLSLLTGRPFHLSNVRARRPKPGLRPQHLTCVRAAAEIGAATVTGAALGSADLRFEPGRVTAGTYRFDIGTAGATGPVLQTVFLPLALRGEEPSELTLTGGTHVQASPCFHFLQTTWRAYLERMGLHVELAMDRPGFYPRGGGVVRARIEPRGQVTPLQVGERGKVKLSGFSAVAGLPQAIAQRQAWQTAKRLRRYGFGGDIPTETWHGGPGTVLAVVAEADPVPALFFGLGARGKTAEKVADEAVDQVVSYLQAASGVDSHSADQIVLPLAFASGSSQFAVAEVTRHLTTNVAVIRAFVEREIVCGGDEGKEGSVHIH